jgi:hypothetical protein
MGIFSGRNRKNMEMCIILSGRDTIWVAPVVKTKNGLPVWHKPSFQNESAISSPTLARQISSCLEQSVKLLAKDIKSEQAEFLAGVKQKSFDEIERTHRLIQIYRNQDEIQIDCLQPAAPDDFGFLVDDSKRRIYSRTTIDGEIVDYVLAFLKSPSIHHSEGKKTPD